MTTHLPARMRATVIWTAVGLGSEGLFTAFAAHADLAIIAGAWAGMIVRLAHQADRHLDRDTAFKIATGIVVGLGGMALGVKAANTWLAYTGVGTLPAMVCNAGTNGIVTYIVGCAIARVFLSEDRTHGVQEIVTAVLRILRPGPTPPQLS